MSKLKNRITEILESLNENIHERDEVISIALLSALADQNIFLFGPPGTAKSLISRRLANAFETESYFEYLMQKFSTPEEVFGPISITELKKDNYVRKTNGFLPNAEFAFLDEIWKSSPAILNTLLTVINEKLFRNGSEVKKVPLKVLISASNETPPSGQGLEALYDRFLTRLYVPPMEDKKNFESLLGSASTSSDIHIRDDIRIRNDEWEQWKKEIGKIKLSDETLNVIHSIRFAFEEKGNELDIYVSDRRWQRAANLLKAGAFFCDRDETSLVDTLLLRHCLWTTNDNREAVITIVEEAVQNNGFEIGVSWKELDKEQEYLEHLIEKECSPIKNIFKIVNLNGSTKFFECSTKYDYLDSNGPVTKIRKFYIPVNKTKSKDEFSPLDEDANIIKGIRCQVTESGICTLKINHKLLKENKDDDWKDLDNLTLGNQVLIQNEYLNETLAESLQFSISVLKEKIEKKIQQIDSRLVSFKNEINTPFVREDIQNIALDGVMTQKDEMKVRLKDCERLESLVGQYEQTPI